MPDAPEMFANLPPSETALLWAMRVWVIGHCRQHDVSARIDAAWQALGLEDALVLLENFMAALARGPRRPIEVLCLCRAEVSADERPLLDAFAGLQLDDMVDARSRLCALMSATAATEAVHSADALARRFLHAGLVLPWTKLTSHGLAASPPHRLLH